MKIEINGNVLELVMGDITDEETDAIVNAANNTLLGGGGVDGAIHRRGGLQILKECVKLRGCKTGDAKITSAGKLKAKYVIHTVGPIYRKNVQNVGELLASAYRRSLEVATENGVHSISFPSISTGGFGYPLDEAAGIALKTVIEYLEAHSTPGYVRFVLYDPKTLGAYEEALKDMDYTGKPPV